MPISPDAALGAFVTVGLAFTGGLWKIATMLAEVRGQVRHNGGSSLKDYVRDARDAATAARDAAQYADARAEKCERGIQLLDSRLDESARRGAAFEVAADRRLTELDHHTRDTKTALELHLHLTRARGFATQEKT